MKYTAETWAEKKKNGMLRFLFVDGVLFTGGPFALIMQIAGVFFMRDEGQGVIQYLSSSRMWTTFFLHATLFGLIMGFVFWYRNEKAFGSKA